MDTTLAKRLVRNFPWRHIKIFTRIKPSIGKVKERKAATQKED